jgi:hypothetical protein
VVVGGTRPRFLSLRLLVVAAGELDVIEDYPDADGVELGEGGQAGQEVGLVDGAQHSCHGGHSFMRRLSYPVAISRW